MCGITGIISNHGRVDQQLLSGMTAMLRHRGPDDSGVALLNGGAVGLGNTRLSIIDLSAAGHMPMALDERYWITYNGEIYNFLELRHELESKGHRFRSQTDTEVILHAYQEWGRGCLDRLNGMFAFAIWDQSERRLFAARDRLGIKPFYYTQVDGDFMFASEFKAFLSHPHFRREIDPDALLSVLQFLWIPGPKTIFKSVLALLPGHFLTYADGRLEVMKYWDIPPPGESALKPQALIEELCERLEQAVERQLMSDVPVGVLLSGGIDSSALVALMSKLRRDRIRTYTIVYRNEDMQQEAMPNDAEYARKVSARFNTIHHEIVIDPDIASLLPRILWHLDDPLSDPAAINTYLISKMAKEDGTTVLLTGAGGDEIFSGYRKHLSALLASYYQQAPLALRRRVLEPIVAALPVAGVRKGYRLNRWMKRFAKSASLDSVQSFMGNYAYFSLEELNETLDPSFRVDGLNYAFTKHYEAFRSAVAFDYVNQMCYVDTKLFLPNLNLMYTDKAMMAASVEGRPCLLDHELVEFAFRIPGNLKIRGLTQKYIFKKAMERYLPRDVVYRAKSPFGAPLRSWMRGQLLPMVRDLYSHDAVRKRGIFRYDVIAGMIEENRTGREDYAHRLWSLLTLELWFREFIDNPGNHPALGPGDAHHLG